MKNQSHFLIAILFVIFFAVLIIIPANADVIFPGMKIYDRCVSISNLSDYPDVVFVGYITGPVIQYENTYIINSSECLTQFYKANDLTIYAVEKEYFENIGLDNIDFESDPNVLSYTFDINVDSEYTVVANPLTKEERYYSVAGFNDTALILYEERRVSYYGSIINKEEIFDEPKIPDIRSVINDSKTNIENSTLNYYFIEIQENSNSNETEIFVSSENCLILKPTLKSSILDFFKKQFGNDCWNNLDQELL